MSMAVAMNFSPSLDRRTTAPLEFSKAKRSPWSTPMIDENEEEEGEEANNRVNAST